MIQSIMDHFDFLSLALGFLLGLLGTWIKDRSYPFFNRNKIFSEAAKTAPSLLLQQIFLDDFDLQCDAKNRVYYVSVISQPDHPRKYTYNFRQLSSQQEFADNIAIIYRIQNRSDTKGCSLVGLQSTDGKFIEAGMSNNQIEPQESITLIMRIETALALSSLKLETGNFIFKYSTRYQNETRNPEPEVTYREDKKIFSSFRKKAHDPNKTN